MVEGTGLENRQAGNGLEGSNPSLSAIFFIPKFYSCCYNTLMQEGSSQIGWKYTAGASQQPSETHPSHFEAVSWTASEYVSHDKSMGWFIRFGAVALLAIGFIYLLTRDVTSVVLLSILGIVFAVFAGRKPEVLEYSIDNSGIQVGRKLYPINVFRSFSIIQEGAIRSILLMPLKRFMPAISVYYAPEDETKIINALGDLLPHEDRKQDPIDKLMLRIRF